MYLSRPGMQISNYIKSPFDCEYRELIESVLNSSILKRIAEDTFSYDLIPIRDYLEHEIVRELVLRMKTQLNYTYRNNDTGYFGVIRQNRSGCMWSYLNLVENRYVYSRVIYAGSLDELEAKVASANSLWYEFDSNLAVKSRQRDSRFIPKKPENKAEKEIIRAKPKNKPVSAIDEIRNKRKLRQSTQKRNIMGLRKPFDNLDLMFR